MAAFWHVRRMMGWPEFWAIVLLIFLTRLTMDLIDWWQYGRKK